MYFQRFLGPVSFRPGLRCGRSALFAEMFSPRIQHLFGLHSTFPFFTLHELAFFPASSNCGTLLFVLGRCTNDMKRNGSFNLGAGAVIRLDFVSPEH